MSVSRVGSAAQTKAIKSVSGSLKLDLAQYNEMLSFAQFGSDLDSATQATINHGARLQELLKQPQYSPLSMVEQVLSLFAAKNGYLKTIAVKDVAKFEKYLHKYVKNNGQDVIKTIDDEKIISKETSARLFELMDACLKEFKLVNGD